MRLRQLLLRVDERTLGRSRAGPPLWVVAAAALLAVGLPALYVLRSGGPPAVALALLALVAVPLSVALLLRADVSGAAEPARRRRAAGAGRVRRREPTRPAAR